jgi:hypothetical protein
LRTFTGKGIFTVAVKKPQEVKVGGALEREAIRLLRDVPGVLVEPKTKAGDRPDAIIRVGSVTHHIEVKAQPLTNAAAAQQLIAYAQHLPDPTRLVVVAHTITEDARERLAEAGIGFFDAAGAKFLDLPGLYLWTEARTPDTTTAPKDAPGVRLAGKAGVATEALLHQPQRRWRIQELANEAKVSIGLVHRLFLRLEREGLVEAEGTGPHKARRVTQPGPLLDLWAEEMRDRGVRQLRAFRLARDPRAQAAALSRALHDAGIDHAVTGAAAAARLAPFVTAVPVTDVWVSELVDLEQAARVTKADTVSDGNNVVFRSAKDDGPLVLRERHDGTWLADTFRIYLDLRNDPRRGREQADRLREEVVGF